MSEIQTLTVRIQDLQKSFDSWNNWYVMLVAVTVFLALVVFFSQFMSVRRGKQLSYAQNELLQLKDKQLERDLKDKDLKIAGAKERASKADEMAGKANARAEEAKLELAKFRAQRGLTKEHHAEFVANLKEFSGTAFDISGSSNETLIFALDITDALTEAGWNIVSWTGGGIVRNLPGRTFSAGDVVTTGVHIQIFDPIFSKASNALVNALKLAGFEGVQVTLENVPHEHPNRNVIHINVGPKP